jgi:CW-type Zinc Finger
VIDNKTIERCFTAQELVDLLDNLIWVQCELCEKWRVLVNEVSEENIPEEWDCSMNSTDPCNNTCETSEKNQAWYEQKYYSASAVNDGVSSTSPIAMKKSSNETHQKVGSTPEKEKSSRVKEERVGNDDILGHLLEVTDEGKKQKLICEHYFHESLMETTQSSDELEKVRRLLLNQ